MLHPGQPGTHPHFSCIFFLTFPPHDACFTYPMKQPRKTRNRHVICRSFPTDRVDEAVISLRSQGATAWVESDALTGEQVLCTDFGRLSVALAGQGRMLRIEYQETNQQ